MEINVLIGNIPESDKELFFGPLEDDVFFNYGLEVTYADILVEHGFFSSKSQARKSGWNKEIPKGFQDFRIGKKKRRLTILKEFNGEV